MLGDASKLIDVNTQWQNVDIKDALNFKLLIRWCLNSANLENIRPVFPLENVEGQIEIERQAAPKLRFILMNEMDNIRWHGRSEAETRIIINDTANSFHWSNPLFVSNYERDELENQLRELNRLYYTDPNDRKTIEDAIKKSSGTGSYRFFPLQAELKKMGYTISRKLFIKNKRYCGEIRLRQSAPDVAETPAALRHGLIGKIKHLFKK